MEDLSQRPLLGILRSWPRTCMVGALIIVLCAVVGGSVFFFVHLSTRVDSVGADLDSIDAKLNLISNNMRASKVDLMSVSTTPVAPTLVTLSPTAEYTFKEVISWVQAGTNFDKIANLPMSVLLHIDEVTKRTILHYAAESGVLDVFKWLPFIRWSETAPHQDATLTHFLQPDSQGHTPLYLAVMARTKTNSFAKSLFLKELVHILCQSKSTETLKEFNKGGLVPLHPGVGKNDAQSVKIFQTELSKHGECASLTTTSPTTPRTTTTPTTTSTTPTTTSTTPTTTSTTSRLTSSTASTLTIRAVTTPKAGIINTTLNYDLTSDESYLYINDRFASKGFRAQKYPDGYARVRLNLKVDDIRMYMIDAEFRKTINALVQNPRTQIWSDVVVLDLSPTFFERNSPRICSNIDQLANLVNLVRLDLSNTKVTDISPLTSLKNLKNIDLTGSLVTDMTPIANMPGLTIKK